MSEVTTTATLGAGQTAVRRLVALGCALVALVLMGAVALIAGGLHALDDLQAREDAELVRSAMTRALDAMVGDITTATVWDQAYRELKPGGDLNWADAEIGSYFVNNRGHDRAVAIDGQGRALLRLAGRGPRRSRCPGRLPGRGGAGDRDRAHDRAQAQRPPAERAADQPGAGRDGRGPGANAGPSVPGGRLDRDAGTRRDAAEGRGPRCWWSPPSGSTARSWRRCASCT
jgi:hypothetical protein